MFLDFLAFSNIYFYLFIWLLWVLVSVCIGIYSLPRDGSPGPLNWEYRILAAGPPGKSLMFVDPMNKRDEWKELSANCAVTGC